MASRLGALLIAIAAAAICSGCSSSPQLAEVEGKVTLNGQPLDKILVEFWPSTSAPRSMAVTDSEGRFVLKTDDGKSAGAVIGNHKVILRDTSINGPFLGREGEDVDISEGRKPRISNIYSAPDTTTVSQVVVAGTKNEFEIKVEL